jgi:hypothetical protein
VCVCYLYAVFMLCYICETSFQRHVIFSDSQMKGQEVRADESGQNQDLDVKFHEAGWDSFCTGYCFIRLAHIFAHMTFSQYVH